MPKFIIERELPGAGNLSDADLQGIAEKSCGVLRELGTDIQWIESYVAGDKIYCVYRSTDEELIRKHALQGGFPANLIARVRATIDPGTAEPVA